MAISPKLVKLRLEGQRCAGSCGNECGDELRPGDLVGTVNSRRVCESCWNAAKWAEEQALKQNGLTTRAALDAQAQLQADMAEWAAKHPTIDYDSERADEIRGREAMHQLAVSQAEVMNAAQEASRAGRPICPSCTGRGWHQEFANTCTACAGKGVVPDTDGAEIAARPPEDRPQEDDVDPGLAALRAAGGLDAEPVLEVQQPALAALEAQQEPAPVRPYVDHEVAPVPAYSRTRQVELLGAALAEDQIMQEAQEVLLDALHPYAGGDPEAALADAKQVILEAIRQHPRSLQRTIGPSEIGTACQHCLAAKLAQWEQLRDDPWLPTVGTAVHAWIEQAFRALQAGQPPSQRRWLVEARVLVGHINGVPVEGSTDLVDLQAGLINDWKVVGASTLTAAKLGPSEQYRTQQHLYAHGWNAAGVKVDWVGIAYLPRNAQSLRSAIWWKQRYDPQVAEAALAKATEVAQVLEALETISVEARDAYITGLPRMEGCYDCKRYPDQPARALDLTAGGLLPGGD